MEKYSTKKALQFFITFFSIYPPTLTSTSTNHSDLLSLLAFKSAINIDPQGALSTWNQTLPFCRWNGIRCGRHRHNRDRVVVINLTSQGLVGPLSPHITNLSFLTTIILQNNSFHGQIPREIGLLKRLRTIHFSNNSLVGTIPTNLSQFRNLVYLNLIDNDLSGNIPVQLGSLSKLEILGLGFNHLSGHIPPFIGNITSLLQLSLPECGLTGEIPESLGHLQRLTFLQLGTNNLTGTIPSSLFNISSLKYLGVNTNHLRGVIPSTIGLTLPNLIGLFLYNNHFTGPVPFSISNASFLKYLEFNGNYFTGPLPRFNRLTHLQFFVFESNLIADDIGFISSLTNSTNLEALQGGDNLLTGSLPDSIANLSTRLSSLSLYMNKIHGNIPLSIDKLVGLTSVNLSDNYLEGPIPLGIAKLFKLQELFLERNKLRGEIPSSIGNLTLLNSFFLSGNNLSGNVPSSLGNCTNLLELDLSRNNFNGFIRQEIVSLSSVSIVFRLSYNDFVGPISDEVGSLKNLETLDLSNNRLSGRIPDSLAKCLSLQHLYLEGNLLEGEIPSGMSALMGLQDLDLSRNNLSGPIPSYLGKLNLESLNLSFNRLQGEVPNLGVFKNKTSISLDGNKDLCGGIKELNLPPCTWVKPKRNKHLTTLVKILIPIVGGGSVCVCLVLFASFAYRRRRSRKHVEPCMSPFTGIQFMRLSYADLFNATGGFSTTNLLGVGSSGSVYKGILDDGQTLVAVKVFDLLVGGASRSFMAECNALREVRHRNLLKILTVCESTDFQGNEFKALIYEYMANGSLEYWLHHDGSEESAKIGRLTMIQRLNIAINIAQALEYLHFGTDSSIVHGDLKPSNILLDHDMTARVGDFGLAKIILHEASSYESSSSIGIRGTLGYVAPEYALNNLISVQGDMYSFGILLLEMFTNKRPTDEAFGDHVNLHSFVSNALADHVVEIIDPSIVIGHGDMKISKVTDCLGSVLRIGLACSTTIPKNRMLITDVVRDLCKIRDYLS